MFAARHREGALVLFVVSVLLVGVSASPAPPDGTATTAGWSALWSNDFTKAQELFRSALAADRSDQSARRGLILSGLATGDDDLVEEELEAYGDRIPSSPFDFFLPQVVQRLSELDSRGFYRTLFDYARNLARGRELPPVDRRVYASLAAHYAYLAGDAGAVEKIARDLNRITDWCVLGPFDNTSGCGHRKDYADARLVLNAPYIGKFGQRIRWFSPAHVSLDRSLNPTAYFHEPLNTTAYVRTTLRTEDGGRYLVSVGHAGAVEFRINDVVVHEGSRLAGGEEVLHWEVDLAPGENLFAFKISNREDASHISCAVSDPDGSSAGRIRIDPALQMSKLPTAPLNIVSVTAGFLDELEALERSSPDDPEVCFWDLFRAGTYAEPDSAVALCDAVAERFPDCALMRLAVAEVYGDAGEEDRRRQTTEAAATLSPDLAPAVLFVASQDMERKRYSSARTAAESVLHRAPSCRGALEVRLESLLREQRLEELKDAAEQVARDHDDEPLGYTYLARHAGAVGLSSEEDRYTQKMIERMPTHSAIITGYLESAEEKDYGEMESEIRRFIELVPDSDVLRAGLAQVLLSRDRIDRAWDVVDDGLRSFPQSVPLIYLRALFAESGYDFDQKAVPSLFPGGWRTLTDAELDAMYPDGNVPTRQLALRDAEAVEKWFRAYAGLRAADFLEDALLVDPGNFEIRDKIRALRGKPSYRTFMPDPDQRAAIAMKVSPEAYEGEGAVVLLEKKRRLAFDRHASVGDYCLAVQILNEEGKRRWERYPINVSPYANDVILLETKTIKEDGTEFEAQTAPPGLLFTNVEPGDIIFLHYQVTTHVAGALSGNFWDAHLFSFPEPCLKSDYVLITPGDVAVRFELHNAAAFADSIDFTTRELEDGFTAREWSFRSPPRDVHEPGAVPARSYLPWVDVSTIGGWETVAEWYSDLAVGQAEVTRRIRELSAALVAGAESEDEEILRVLRFVSDDVTYQSIPFFQSAFVPREADEVLRDRLGDCKDKSTLMIALLAAIGLTDCHLALVTPGSDEGLAYLPSPRFEHVVVHRSLPDGSSRWYDPTVRFPAYGQLPRELAGAPALVAREGEEALRVIPAQNVCDHPRRVTSDVELSAGGDAKVRRTASLTSIDATSPLRVHLSGVSQSEVEEEVLTRLATDCPGVELISLDVRGVDDPDSALVFRYAFDAPNLLATTGGILSGSLPVDSGVSDAFGAIVAKKERVSPIDLRALRMCEDLETSVEYPDGYEIVAVPDDREYRFGDCLYTTRYEAAGHTLRIERKAVIAGDRVGPARYPEFKTFLEGILQDLKTPLLLRGG